MIAFPTEFSAAPEILSGANYNDSKGYLKTLTERGYYVQLGMMPEDVTSVQALARQASIRRFCPNDLKRFGEIEGDPRATEKWLEKGRLAFLLKELGSSSLAGYGWSGPGNTEHILEGDMTFAVRLSELHQGKGLATPFLGSIVDYTMEIAPDAKPWIEAWESNESGIHVDKKVGFKVVASLDDIRPNEDGTIVQDTRYFMTLDEAA